MVKYSIKVDAGGAYAVVVVPDGGVAGYTAITFATRQRAEHWIETRQELDKRRPPEKAL